MRRVVISLVLLFGAPALAEDPPAPVAMEKEADPFSIEETGRLSISVSHAYLRAEASTRLSYLLAYWKKRFNVASEWRGDRVFLSGTVYGIKIQAMFEVGDSAVVGFARDPGWPWRSQISNYVDRKLKKYLNPTYDDP